MSFVLLPLVFLAVVTPGRAQDAPGAGACVVDAHMAGAQVAESADTDAVSGEIVKTTYVVCRFDPAEHHIRLFLGGDDGAPFSHFDQLNAALSLSGERLIFAMNAGMYHKSRAPVGLYVERGVEHAPLNTNDGPGNFHMKPNGVFWTWAEDGHRGAHVSSSKKFASGAARDVVAFATQSGPMLVIDGEIHPRFLPDSTSLKRRNGVGVTPTGEVIFVLADTPVRFYDFARYFRDQLKTPNALYLDGAISRLYAPDLGRNDPGVAMGPIVGVVIKND